MCQIELKYIDLKTILECARACVVCVCVCVCVLECQLVHVCVCVSVHITVLCGGESCVRADMHHAFMSSAGHELGKQQNSSH